MIALGECSGNELGTVAALAFLVMPSERLGEGVQVECIDGHRVWTGATKHGAFRVVGDTANFTGRHVLHLRLIRDADALVDANGAASIVIDGDISRVVSGDASGQMPLARVTPDTAMLEQHSPTSATISIEGLRHVLWTGTHDPAEGFSEEESSAVGPRSAVHFGEGTFGVSTSYSEVGCVEASSQWAAEVSGPNGRMLISRWALRRLLGQLFFSNDTTLRLSADLERGGALHIDGDCWHLAVPEAPTQAGAFYRELYDKLDACNLLSAEHEDGRLAALVGEVEVVLQLLDGRWPIVRCTAHIVGGVRRSPELLDEIDQQNEGRAFTKYFMSGESVFASIDVRCTDIARIDDYLFMLADDSALLGNYLAALGASEATPALW